VEVSAIDAESDTSRQQGSTVANCDYICVARFTFVDAVPRSRLNDASVTRGNSDIRIGQPLRPVSRSQTRDAISFRSNGSVSAFRALADPRRGVNPDSPAADISIEPFKGSSVMHGSNGRES